MSVQDVQGPRRSAVRVADVYPAPSTPDPRDEAIAAVWALAEEADGPHGDYNVRPYEIRDALDGFAPAPEKLR